MASNGTRSSSVELDQLGYPLDIFDKGFDRKFLCSSCHLILRDPVQSYCGHRFCQKCIKAIIELGDDKQCDSCREDGIHESECSIIRADQQFPDNAIKREMGRMQAKCTHSGCSWSGIFKSFESHSEECQYKLVACPYHCNTTLAVGMLENHIRNECPMQLVDCKFCKQQIRAGEREEHINRDCLKYRVKCDMCGKKRIPREKLEEHKSECGALKHSCPACSISDVDKDTFAKHIVQNAPSHLSWCLKQLSEESFNSFVEHAVKNNIGDIRQKIDELESRFQVKIEETVKKVASSYATVASPSFSRANGPETSISLENFQREIDRISSTETRIETFESIVGVLHREIEHCLTAINALDNRSKMDQQIIGTYEEKLKGLERNLALKDLALTEMNEKLKYMEQASFDGTLLWKISEFSKVRQEAVEGRSPSVYSSPFYTSKYGYKMCCRLYPNGDGMGKGKFLSLFFVVMKSNYDVLLPWPFQQKVTLIVIDQNNKNHVSDTFLPDPSSTSFRKPTTEMNIASGCPKFLPLSALDDRSGYLINDTMFIRIIVDATGLEGRMIGFDEKLTLGKL